MKSDLWCDCRSFDVLHWAAAFSFNCSVCSLTELNDFYYYKKKNDGEGRWASGNRCCGLTPSIAASLVHKPLKYTPLSVYVRDAFRISTWSLSSGLCFQVHEICTCAYQVHKCQVHFISSAYIYIYIYICMCVCLHVTVHTLSCTSLWECAPDANMAANIVSMCCWTRLMPDTRQLRMLGNPTLSITLWKAPADWRVILHRAWKGR